MSLELKYIMILSSSTLEKSDFLDVFVSKARWDCPTLVTLRTLMSTRLGTLAQNTVNAHFVSFDSAIYLCQLGRGMGTCFIATYIPAL